jgi:hypothetical protein
MEEYLIFGWFIVFALVAALISYIIHKIFKKKWLDYGLSVAVFVFALFNLIMAKFGKNDGFTDLAYFVSFMLFASSFIGTAITAFLLNRKK